MENLKQTFSKILARWNEFFGKLSGIKKAMLAGVVVLAVLGVAGAALVQKEEPYEYLFENLTPEDSQQVQAFFKQNNIETYLSDSRGIKVPPAQVPTLRLKLAQEGLPAHGVVGWEKFDTQEFTRTDFEQRINKQRAIQGELSRTIQMIEGVTSAKVMITTPKKALFMEDHVEATAAVYLKTKNGVTLDKKQIKGIVNLVSKSVEGLKANNVTIIDSEGKMLTEAESDDPAAKLTKETAAHKRQVEKQYEENIRDIVGRVVGLDRVAVKVDAVIDFTQEQQTISDVDPDRVVPVSRETQGYNLSGQGLNPTGIPGSKSNVPGEQETVTAGGGNSTSSKKDSEVVNFEISKKVSQKVLPSAKLTKLSAAVLVDGRQEYLPNGLRPSFEPRTEEEIKQIEDLVRSSIGFDEKRGDIVTVRNMMFQLDPTQMETIKEEAKESWDNLKTLAVASVVALALVLFFAFIVRPYFRWLAYDPSRKQQQQVVEDFKPDLELGSLQNVQVKEDVPFEKLSAQEQVLFLAKNEPKRTTEAIRLLLNPHHSAGGI